MPSASEITDYGTFYMGLAAPAVTMAQNEVTLLAELPHPNEMVNFDGNHQAGYLLIGIQGTGYSLADAGLAFKDGAWTVFTTTFVDEHEFDNTGLPADTPILRGMMSQYYHLGHINADGTGIIPLHESTEPLRVSLRVDIPEDNHIRISVEPIDGAVWYDPWMVNVAEKDRFRGLLVLDEDGKPKAVTLGHLDVGEPNPGDGGNEYPSQVVPGVKADGFGNRWSIQWNIGVRQDEPAPGQERGEPKQPKSGSHAPGMMVTNLQINGVSWDIHAKDEDDPFKTRIIVCPPDSNGAEIGPFGVSDSHPVYTIHEGSTVATSWVGAFGVTIDVKNDSVHGCFDATNDAMVDCEPVPDLPPEASSGETWGDPHIFTLDGGIYTFMATGDYILTESTQPGDDFMVQVRFRPFQAPPGRTLTPPNGPPTRPSP